MKKGYVKHVRSIYDSLREARVILDSVLAEISYLEARLCEDSGGHYWKFEEKEEHPDGVIFLVHKCTECGCARMRQESEGEESTKDIEINPNPLLREIKNIIEQKDDEDKL